MLVIFVFHVPHRYFSRQGVSFMDPCPLSRHLGTPERLEKLRAAFRSGGERLTLEQFRSTMMTIAPEFGASRRGSSVRSDAATLTMQESESFLSPLVHSPQRGEAAEAGATMDVTVIPSDGLAPDEPPCTLPILQRPPDAAVVSDQQHVRLRTPSVCDSGSDVASPLLDADDEVRFAKLRSAATSTAPAVTFSNFLTFRPPPPSSHAKQRSSMMRHASFPNARSRVVVLGESPQNNDLTAPQTARASPPRALPVYRAASMSVVSSQGEAEDSLPAVSRRVSRLQIRDELSQAETADPIKRIFYRLDTTQSGTVEWETLLAALVAETQHHDAALAEDHRSYVFSRCREPKPLTLSSTAAHVNEKDTVYRLELAKHQAAAKWTTANARTSRPPRRTRAPLTALGQKARPKMPPGKFQLGPSDTSVVLFLDGLPSHPTLFALSSRTLPLGLFHKTTLELVKKFDLSQMGSAVPPELVDYLPAPDLLFCYSSADRHIRALMGAEASGVCVFRLAPMHLEHTVRRLRTSPKHFPFTLFCATSHGDVLVIDAPNPARSDAPMTLRQTISGLHSPDCGGVVDFVMGKGCLFTFGHDRRVRCVELASGLVTDIALIGDALRFLTLNTTRNLLVGVSYVGEVCVWDTKSQTLSHGAVLNLRGHRPHKAEIVSLMSVPGRPEVITVDMSGQVRVWDLRQLVCVQATRADGKPDDDTNGDVLYGSASTAASNLEGGSASSIVADSMGAKTLTRRYLCAFRGAAFIEQTQEVIGYTSERLFCMHSSSQVADRLCDWDVVLYPLFDSQNNAFVLQGPCRTTVWDGTFGHRRFVADRALDPQLDPAAREVTACCVDGVSGHLFLATATGDVEVHATRAIDVAVPLRRFSVPDGFVTDMQYCDGLRLLVGIGTSGSLLLYSEDPYDRFMMNVGVSSVPLYQLAVSEDLGLVAFVDNHNRIIVRDLKKSAGLMYQLALDRRTLAMTFTGDASVLVTAHEAHLLVLWSVPPALEVFAQLAVFDCQQHALSTHPFQYHCFHQGLMDKGPTLAARKFDANGSPTQTTSNHSPHSLSAPRARGFDTQRLRKLVTPSASSREGSHRASGDVGKRGGQPDGSVRNTQLLTSLLDSTIRDWSTTVRALKSDLIGTRDGLPSAGEKEPEQDPQDVEPWNAARVDCDVTCLAYHPHSHHLFVGDGKGDVRVYALCALLQAYKVQRSTYEARARFTLRVPSAADTQLGKTTPQLVANVQAVRERHAGVASLRYEPALQAVLCSGEDLSVTVLDERGAETAFFSMRRLPPAEWLQSALDPSSDNSTVTVPTSRSVEVPSPNADDLPPFRLSTRLRCATGYGVRDSSVAPVCSCTHKVRTKPLATTLNVYDISFLARSLAFCLNDSIKLSADTLKTLVAQTEAGKSVRPPSGARCGSSPRQGPAVARTVPVSQVGITEEDHDGDAHSSASEGPARMHVALLRDELMADVAWLRKGEENTLLPLAVGGALTEMNNVTQSAPSPPPPPPRGVTRARPCTAQACVMRSSPYLVGASRPETSRAGTDDTTTSVLRLGGSASPSPLPPLAAHPQCSPYSECLLSAEPAVTASACDRVLTPQTAVSARGSPSSAPLPAASESVNKRGHPLPTGLNRSRPRTAVARCQLETPSPLRTASRPRRPCTGPTSSRLAGPQTQRLGQSQPPADLCQAALEQMLVEYKGELQNCLTRHTRSARGASRAARRGLQGSEEDRVSHTLLNTASFF